MPSPRARGPALARCAAARESRGPPAREEAPLRDALHLCALLLALAACASQNGPAYPDFAASAPPIAPGRARLIVYRTLYTEPQGFYAKITVDGAAVGTLPMGTWLWVDEPAGIHKVGSPLWLALSAFGNQLSTTPLEVELAPGTTSFVSVNLISTGPVQVSLVPVGAGQAQNDLATLEMAPPAASLE